MSDDDAPDDWEPLHEEGRFVGPLARYLRMTPLDRPGRRALWARFVHAHTPCSYDPAPTDIPRIVILRAGREGDDARVTLCEGDVLTAKVLDDIVDLLLTMRFGLGDLYDLADHAWHGGPDVTTTNPTDEKS